MFFELLLWLLPRLYLLLDELICILESYYWEVFLWLPIHSFVNYVCSTWSFSDLLYSYSRTLEVYSNSLSPSWSIYKLSIGFFYLLALFPITFLSDDWSSKLFYGSSEIWNCYFSIDSLCLNSLSGLVHYLSSSFSLNRAKFLLMNS